MAKLSTLKPRLHTVKGNRLSIVSDSWRDNTKSSTKRGYGYKWQKARELFIQANPLCVYCKANGRDEPARVVDHIIPHRGNKDLFWDRSNWQSLCMSCHSSVKQREEKEASY